ncbi:hypothetical protein CA267_007745 [Alteromonas pelagimontana]|uniref:Uncharacterized protein n=1 Tax=Alteromonas pelagimontana TaxID=1858656 RepID=A0A6M4MBW9_9ALTE|nr:hypothetical protein [Alteromonas pelagimontana]QJR80681.1 hypothetical protein CA267_007745 [Alteromonas pelagimontana]
MQKWLLLVSLLFLSPCWADGKQDAVSFQTADVVAAGDYLPEEKAEKSATSEPDNPDTLLFGWRELIDSKVRSSYAVTASASIFKNQYPSSIRAPPVLLI